MRVVPYKGIILNIPLSSYFEMWYRVLLLIGVTTRFDNIPTRADNVTTALITLRYALLCLRWAV